MRLNCYLGVLKINPIRLILMHLFQNQVNQDRVYSMAWRSLDVPRGLPASGRGASAAGSDGRSAVHHPDGQRAHPA